MGHVDAGTDRVLRFAVQLGLRSIQFHNPVDLRHDRGFWLQSDLAALVQRCTQHGLSVDGIENVPREWFDAILLGDENRDQQIEHYCRSVRHLGAAGIRVLGYNFLATYVWRTEMAAVGRGGARVTSFDLDRALADGNAAATHRLATPELTETIDADTLAANHRYFLDAVLPVAAEAGVRLALHPDDPPVAEPLGGADRIFTTPDSLIAMGRRLTDSPWALNLCIGTVSEMGGQQAVDQVIEALAPTGQIASVHFRDVRGSVPRFSECFVGEGNVDPAEVVRRLAAGGFDGFIIDDHVPAMENDPGTWGDISPEAYCSRGRAHAIGYLQGLLNAVTGDRPVAHDERGQQ